MARGEAQQIGRHPHLPIAVVTGSDADHGQVQLAAQIAGQSLGNVFEHQGEATGVLQLPRLARPALVLHGLQDALIPPDNGRALAARLPRATLVELPEASHWLMTDSNAACLQALQQHLNTHRS